MVLAATKLTLKVQLLKGRGQIITTTKAVETNESGISPLLKTKKVKGEKACGEKGKGRLGKVSIVIFMVIW